MSNFYKDNKDIKFYLDNTDLKEIVTVMEDNYTQSSSFDYAPRNFEEAIVFYNEILNLAGEITGTTVAKNAESVDEEGSSFKDGIVTYAKGIKEDLDILLKADFGGMTLPRKYGGLNLPTTVSTMVIEMISRADASLMNIVGLQDIGETINEFASEEQKLKYLPKFTKGEVTGAMILTEPDAGSDLQSVQTKAIYDDIEGVWKIYGVKRFITNGCADVSLVLARSEENVKDGRGLSMFLIERDKTVQIRRIENKHGIHGSPTCELQFNGTRAELVGKRKMGLIRYTMSLMNGARLSVSAQALGIAEAAYREAFKYAKERKQYGQAIIEFPAVYNMLTRMKMEIEAARTIVYETCKYVDYKKIYTKLSEENPNNNEYKIKLKEYSNIASLLTPMAKAYSSEMSNRVCYDAVQIHGGTGYMKEFPVERLSRDARITNIYEGTTQLQIIAALSGILSGVYENFISSKYENNKYNSEFNNLIEKTKTIQSMFNKALKTLKEKKDKEILNFYASNIVETAIDIFISYRFLEIAAKDNRKKLITKLYVENAYCDSLKKLEPIFSNYNTAIENKDAVIEI
jgi:3-(methylthio)propanoyl-CoA dehydrogenase